jgi:hypothetical protein
MTDTAKPFDKEAGAADTAKPFDKEAGAAYMRELLRSREDYGFETYSEEASRLAIAAEKRRLKQRRKPTDWPLDAWTLEPSGQVTADDVRAPAEPPPKEGAPGTMQFYRAEAAKPGLLAVDPNLQIFRRSQFEREVAADADTRAAQWTDDYVDMRLVESVKVRMRTPDRIGPRAYGSAMPRPLLEMADLISQAENRSLRKTMARMLRNFGRPSAIETKRGEEAEAWMIEYLRECDPNVRYFVGLGALWKAANASISAKCKDLGVSRQCFYERRKVGLQLITRGLMLAGRAPS